MVYINKVKYNVFQNTNYAFKNIWRSGQKTLVVSILAKIPVSFILSVIALYTPTIILNKLELSDTLQQIIAVIISLLMISMAFELINNFIEAKSVSFTQKIWAFYNRRMYEKYLDADYEYYDDPQFQDINNKARQACVNVHTPAMHLPNTFASLIINILLFFISAGLISILNPIIILLLSITVIINYFTLKSVKNYEHRIKDEKASLNRKVGYLAGMSTYFTQAKDIRLYGMKSLFRSKAEVYTENLHRLKKKTEYKYFSTDIINFFMILLRDGIAYFYLVYKSFSGDIGVGEFVLYFTAIGQFAGLFSGIINSWLAIHTSSLQFCDMREFFEIKNKTNRGNGLPVPSNTDKVSIELRNVTYQYPETETPIIKNVNLKIKPGEKIALVGLNGAGKTTLVKLICGMYSPTKGEILVNGHLVNEYNIDEYYSMFSAVFQQFRFLPLSIAHNIAIMTKEQADGDKLNKCIELAGLTNKINSFKMGIDTLLVKEVNPKGAELSGGEQQKLMLARAIYKDAPILMLDEPTSALDPIAEGEMYMKYNEIVKGKTSVFISHRLASTRFCDRIILLADGKIIEMGTHDELVGNGGKYAELFNVQSHYYKEENV